MQTAIHTIYTHTPGLVLDDRKKEREKEGKKERM